MKPCDDALQQTHVLPTSGWAASRRRGLCLRYEGETYWTYVAHGDNFFVHTTLWAEPVDRISEEDRVFAVEPVDLSGDGREVVAEAISTESGAASVETVPPALAKAAETFDALATTTETYVARLQ